MATASVREARNATQFIREVERKARVSVEVLSAIEEGRLIGLAVAQGCGLSGASILNIDIGGGSTEISLVRDSTPDRLLSVKLGAIGLTGLLRTQEILHAALELCGLRPIQAELLVEIDQAQQRISSAKKLIALRRANRPDVSHSISINPRFDLAPEIILILDDAGDDEPAARAACHFNRFDRALVGVDAPEEEKIFVSLQQSSSRVPPNAAGRSLCSPFAAWFPGGATRSQPYISCLPALPEPCWRYSRTRLLSQAFARAVEADLP